MNVARSVDDFIEQMRTVLNETDVDPQSGEQIRRFFSALNGRPEDALNAYVGYATLFYRHVQSVGSSTADVVYPGGPGNNYCDSWNEVLSIASDGNGRRVIDCEGFAVMAVELLGLAGYQFRNYIIPISPSLTGNSWDGHIFVELRNAGTSVFMGNNRTYSTASGATEVIAGWSPTDAVNARYACGQTIREAVEAAQQIIDTRAEDPMSDVRVVAPLSPRCSRAPDVSDRY